MSVFSDPKPVLKQDALYFGDNGRCFCGRHAGMSAMYTGRDISGQKVQRVTPKVLSACKAQGFTPRCEDVRCRFNPGEVSA